MTVGLAGSQKLPEKDEFLEISSDGGVEIGKHVPQEMGDSWVHRTVVGPCVSQKCDSEICHDMSACEEGHELCACLARESARGRWIR
jgi:hypothetical protein